MAPSPNPSVPRPLLSSDLPGAAEIERAVFSDPWSERAFAETLAADHVRAFAIDDEHGTLAGYAVGARAGDQGEILNIAVAPEARRRGLGRRLLKAVLEWFREQQVAEVFLEVRRSNAAAVGLYRRAGFSRHGVRLRYYRNPTEDALVMTLALQKKDAEK